MTLQQIIVVLIEAKTIISRIPDWRWDEDEIRDNEKVAIQIIKVADSHPVLKPIMDALQEYGETKHMCGYNSCGGDDAYEAWQFWS